MRLERMCAKFCFQDNMNNMVQIEYVETLLLTLLGCMERHVGLGLYVLNMEAVGSLARVQGMQKIPRKCLFCLGWSDEVSKKYTHTYRKPYFWPEACSVQISRV
jgi:hypothetical protein